MKKPATFKQNDDQVSLPKSVQKILRYIKQDASIEKIREVERLFHKTIKKREYEYERGRS